MPGSSPRPTRRARPFWVAALAVVVVAFAARLRRIAGSDSITSDESTHLVHALHYWHDGRRPRDVGAGRPRLPHLLNALPTYLVLRHSGRLPDRRGGSRRGFDPAGPLGLASRARPGSGGGDRLGRWRCCWPHSGPSRGVGGPSRAWSRRPCWRWCRRSPPTASIAGSDLPFTAAAFVAIALMARYAEAPSPGRWAGPDARPSAWPGRCGTRPCCSCRWPPGSICRCALRCRGSRGSCRSPRPCVGTAARVRRRSGSSRSGCSGRATASGRSAWGSWRGGPSNLNLPDRLGPIDVSELPDPDLGPERGQAGPPPEPGARGVLPRRVPARRAGRPTSPSPSP